jgi:hypothetical protein
MALSDEDLHDIEIRQMAASTDDFNPIALRLVTEDVPQLLVAVRRLRERLQLCAAQRQTLLATVGEALLIIDVADIPRASDLRECLERGRMLVDELERA